MPCAAAVRVIVDLAVPERRRVTVIEQPELELRAEYRGERPLLGEPGERMRKEREDIDSQSEGE
jgi:hypothetical protein